MFYVFFLKNLEVFHFIRLTNFLQKKALRLNHPKHTLILKIFVNFLWQSYSQQYTLSNGILTPSKAFLLAIIWPKNKTRSTLNGSPLLVFSTVF